MLRPDPTYARPLDNDGGVLLCPVLMDGVALLGLDFGAALLNLGYLALCEADPVSAQQVLVDFGGMD